MNVCLLVWMKEKQKRKKEAPAKSNRKERRTSTHYFESGIGRDGSFKKRDHPWESRLVAYMPLLFILYTPPLYRRLYLYLRILAFAFMSSSSFYSIN